MTESELIAKCHALAAAGDAMAVAVLALVADRDELRRLNLGLADRVEKQSNLLSRKAERAAPALPTCGRCGVRIAYAADLLCPECDRVTREIAP